jgi:hypothetical protein
LKPAAMKGLDLGILFEIVRGNQQVKDLNQLEEYRANFHVRILCLLLDAKHVHRLLDTGSSRVFRT